MKKIMEKLLCGDGLEIMHWKVVIRNVVDIFVVTRQGRKD
jgi:hypothetical protein